ncbi:MAG: peptidase domain-containing ABC transporter [Pseudomonadota bacterium]
MPPALASFGRRRLPVYFQSTASDCGRTAVRMIADYYRVGDVAVATGSDRGVRLADVIGLASQAGLQTRALRLSLREIGRLRTPAILHWKLNHFVVLAGCRRQGCLIHDPSCGRRIVSQDDINRCFTGVALELRPAPDFVPERGRPYPRLRDFASAFTGLGRYLGSMLVLLMSIQVLSLAPAIATQLLIDELVLASDRVWLLRMLAGLALVLIVTSLLDAWQQRISLQAGVQFQLDSALALMRHLYALPGTFFRGRLTGDLLSRLSSLGAIRSALSEELLNGVVQATVLLTTVIAMYVYHAPLATVSLVGGLLMMSCEAATLPVRRRLDYEIVAHHAQEDGSVLATLNGLPTIRNLGLIEWRLRDWQRHASAAMNATARRGLYLVGGGFLRNLCGALDQVLFLGVGLTAVAERHATLGVLFAFMALRGRLGQALPGLLAAGGRLYLLRTHQERLADIVLAAPRPSATQSGVERRMTGRLQLAGVAFAYPGERGLLANINLDISPGEHVAITGTSGCGKSTLLNLIGGGLSPVQGCISIDHIEFDLWHPQARRNGVSMVTQQDALLPGSVAENLCGFDDAPDGERMRAVADAVGIWGLIRRLPMKQNSPVAGLPLSGGEIQRLVLARALYRRPRILLLDEATGSLDAAAEARVLRAIATSGATVVHVTHRPGALCFADRCFKLSLRGLLPMSADKARR